MKKEDLEKLGIFQIESKLHPNRFFIPFLGDVDLEEPYEIKTILRMVFIKGKETGIEQGKLEKIKEMKKVLQIDD